MGTIVNAVAAAAGGFLGLLLKKFVKEEYKIALDHVLGLSVAILGLFGALSSMGSVTDGKIETNGMMLLIISLAIGTFIGTFLHLNDKLDHFGDLIEKKIKISSFSQGFVTATLLYCVGAMTIIGCINDGLHGDPTILYTKAMLDGISAIIMASTLGAGVIFAAFPVLLYQGFLTLAAGWLAPLLSDALIADISMVGYAIVIFIGTNMMGLTKAKTADMLPSILIPVIYSFFN